MISLLCSFHGISSHLGFLSRSASLEEISVRADLALAQKKIINEIVPVNPDEKDILDEEYDNLCAQVVRIRLS
jgi:hypothetical protein